MLSDLLINERKSLHDLCQLHLCLADLKDLTVQNFRKEYYEACKFY